MNFLLSIAFLLLITPSSQITDIRVAFSNAKASEDNAQIFNNLIKENQTLPSNLKLAYLGASEIMLADYGVNIPKKISLFKQGRDILEEALAKDPNNLEIRLVRLIIQTEIPSFLRYDSNKEEDKTFILEHYAKAPSDLKQYIEKSNKDLKLFTADEWNRR